MKKNTIFKVLLTIWLLFVIWLAAESLGVVDWVKWL